MIIKTIDLYEASWYRIKGGVLKEVHFGKATRRETHKSGFIEKWTMTMEVEEQFVRYWKEYRAIVNAREFANARLSLKRKIYKLKKRRATDDLDPGRYWKPKEKKT